MIKEKAAALGLADKVIFTGNQADVSDYYQAMDFLFSLLSLKAFRGR